jgi:hypothetical protein
MNRKDVTNKIIVALEKGVCPWRKTWSNFMHKNQFSGKYYQGINQVLLSLNETAIPFWGTERFRAPDTKRGKSITSRLLYHRKKIKEVNDETKIYDKFLVLRYYNMF